MEILPNRSFIHLVIDSVVLPIIHSVIYITVLMHMQFIHSFSYISSVSLCIHSSNTKSENNNERFPPKESFLHSFILCFHLFPNLFTTHSFIHLYSFLKTLRNPGHQSCIHSFNRKEDKPLRLQRNFYLIN